MKSMNRSKLPDKFAIGGGIVTGIIVLIVSIVSGSRRPGDSAAIVASCMLIGGVAFMGALAGGIIGFIVSACLPRERTTCPKCGSANATVAYKSIVNGKEHPNHCPDCGHEW